MDIFCKRCERYNRDTDFKDAGPERDQGTHKIKQIECTICNTKRQLTLRK